jgi:hypothetical protein
MGKATQYYAKWLQKLLLSVISTISICSYKKQSFKKIWGRILGLVWLIFDVAALGY